MITADEVRTKDDLVIFIRQLRKDFLDVNCEWENDTLSRYLEAMSGWLNDVEEDDIINDNKPVWRSIAYILDVATCYE